MIEVKDWETEDKKHYDIAHIFVKKILGEVKGLFYKIDIDGQEHIVYHQNCRYIIFDILDAENLEYTMFTTDAKGKIMLIFLENYDIRLYEDGDVIFKDKNTEIMHSLSLGENPNYIDEEDVYEGQVEYWQRASGMQVRYMYNHMMNDNKIFGMCLTEPTSIIIEKVRNPNKNSIIRWSEAFVSDSINADKNPIRYTAVAILEHGLKEVLQKGALQTMQESELLRYRKLHAEKFDGNSPLSGPITNLYRLEDIEQKVKKLGFETKVPSFLIAFHNNESDLNKIIAEYGRIAQYFEVDNIKDLEGKQRLSFEITNH